MYKWVKEAQEFSFFTRFCCNSKTQIALDHKIFVPNEFWSQRILVLKILTLYRQPLQTPSLQPPYTLLSRHQSNTYQTFQTPSRYPTETLQAASRHPLDNLQKPSSHNPDTNTRHPLDTHIGPTAVCTCILV